MDPSQLDDFMEHQFRAAWNFVKRQIACEILNFVGSVMSYFVIPIIRENPSTFFLSSFLLLLANILDSAFFRANVRRTKICKSFERDGIHRIQNRQPCGDPTDPLKILQLQQIGNVVSIQPFHASTQTSFIVCFTTLNRRTVSA